MTIAKAITKAMTAFQKEGKGEIRTIKLMEGSGSGNKYEQLTIQIEYAIDGDYTESDRRPFVVNVCERDGKIETETIPPFNNGDLCRYCKHFMKMCEGSTLVGGYCALCDKRRRPDDFCEKFEDKGGKA